MSAAPLRLSVMFFSSDEQEVVRDRYRTVRNVSALADRLGFHAVWLPERHFHRFGGLFPNPAVVAAAVAENTSQIRLRAGSVVLPLHDPIRVAEEWSVVDNLSGGRVDLAFATGWDADSFVLAPDRYATRIDETFAAAKAVRRLWRGGPATRVNGVGREVQVRIHPPPVQEELGVWITATQRNSLFERAAAADCNVLTALLFLTFDELRGRIAEYRSARQAAGLDPSQGRVTLMLHSHVGESLDEARDLARASLETYLDSAMDLWSRESDRLAGVQSDSRRQALQFATERYLRTASLIGDGRHCEQVLQQAVDAGVDEIACLVDFGPSLREIEATLRRLSSLIVAASRPEFVDAG